MTTMKRSMVVSSAKAGGSKAAVPQPASPINEDDGITEMFSVLTEQVATVTAKINTSSSVTTNMKNAVAGLQDDMENFKIEMATVKSLAEDNKKKLEEILEVCKAGKEHGTVTVQNLRRLFNFLSEE